MSNEPQIKITITIEPRCESNLQKAQSPSDPPGFGPIYRGPIRTAPGLHPYQPTKWRDGVASDKSHEDYSVKYSTAPLNTM